MIEIVGILGMPLVPVRADIGPDVIVGDVSHVGDYARLGDTAALAMTTVSCNSGNEVLAWHPLPDNQHPVIAQNMYRLLDGRLEQIGQSWLKHGFFALQTTYCYSDCDPVADGSGLGVRCSDPYSASINQGPNLGPRSLVNPVTGHFDGAIANSHAGHVHTSISHGLQVKHADLSTTSARYFVEAQYVAPDDALAGNGNNNASYREVTVSGTPTDWTFTTVGETVEELPAIFAWSGSSRDYLDSWPEDGRIVVAHKVTAMAAGQYRFDYAVYNMNSERGIRSFSVPVGSALVTNVGFHAVASHDEGFSNDPWVHSISAGRIAWSTLGYSDNPNANAIRWGTMYNFWFEADSGGVGSSALLGRFKPGPGPAFLTGWIRAPSAGDCNENGVDDDQDIAEGASADCNGNGLPDECELSSSDCNGNSVPDDCDLASGTSLDCNSNTTADECETASGASLDCNHNTVPDECEQALDCNGNGIPDACDLAGHDCDANFVPDECQPDCDRNGVIDACEAGPDCNSNGIPDICDVLGLPGGRRDFDSGALELPIPDGNPLGLTHHLSVPTGGELTDVNVEIQIQHTWIADLIITLQHGDTWVTLWDSACGSADDLNVVFDDGGASLVCSSPMSGTLWPVNYDGSRLADFVGQDARGDWVLFLEDTFGADAGMLMRWKLTIETEGIPPTSPDVNGSQVPDECETCVTVEECDDGNRCTEETCTAGLCSHSFLPYGDVNRSGVVDVDDLICLMDSFVGTGVCPTPDLYPCEGDGVVDADDLIAGIYAFTGENVCCGE